MSTLSRREFLAASALAAAVPTLAQTPRSINDFFTDFTNDWVRHDPSLATSTRYFTGDEQDHFDRQLTPNRTQAWRRDRIQRARKGLSDLAKFDRTSLTDSQRLAADLMKWQLDEVVREEPFLDMTFPLEQMNGQNVALVETMTVRYPLSTDRDAENYIAALGQVSARFREAIAESKRLEAKQFIPPKFILEATVKQMQNFTDPAPAQSPFVTIFADKIAAIKSLSDDQRKMLRDQAAKIVAEQIYPAWREGIATLQAQQAKATDDAGLSRLRGGLDAYAYFLHDFTTTDKTAAEIHQIGLDQVARIESQMDALLKKLGRNQGSVKDRIAKLSLDMEYPNPQSEASRAQIMRDIDGIIADSLKRSAQLFDTMRKSPIVARPFPSFRENNAAANYNVPAPDGSRPGVFQYPRRVDKMTKFGLRSTVYHETVPGHHFQLALQVENKSLPRFMQLRTFGGISAVTEGWALYAERLAAESGWYDGDIEGQLGQLDAELFRARRLVVDTGLHAMKWTPQQGIDYGIEASEVERYAVFPGQACSYMMGELKYIELRENAKQTMGSRFSLREYHNQVLKTGVVPLEIMERQINAWAKA